MGTFARELLASDWLSFQFKRLIFVCGKNCQLIVNTINSFDNQLIHNILIYSISWSFSLQMGEKRWNWKYDEDLPPQSKQNVAESWVG